MTFYGPGDRILDLVPRAGVVDLRELGLNERQSSHESFDKLRTGSTNEHEKKTISENSCDSWQRMLVQFVAENTRGAH